MAHYRTVLVALSLLILTHTLCLSEVPSLTTMDLLLGSNQLKNTSYFQEVSSKYTGDKHVFLHKQVLSAFLRMANSAEKDGVSFAIVSGFRSSDYQKYLWETAWTGQRQVDGLDVAHNTYTALEKSRLLLRFHAMPGASRHHWGTDIDLMHVENYYFERGKGLKVYQWLKDNARFYGFCQVYDSQESGRTGYQEEKWHWSYMPLAHHMQDLFLNRVSIHLIDGFYGDHTVKELAIIDTYVKGISSDCVQLFSPPISPLTFKSLSRSDRGSME